MNNGMPSQNTFPMTLFEKIVMILQKHLIEFDRDQVTGDIGSNLDCFERKRHTSAFETGDEAHGGLGERSGGKGHCSCFSRFGIG